MLRIRNSVILHTNAVHVRHVSYKSIVSRIQSIVSPFKSGISTLYQDGKTVYSLKKELRSSVTPRPFTRRESLLLRQTPRDFIKAVPLVLFFGLPLIGSLSPLLGFQFPKQTLPPPFWKEEQIGTFLQEIVEEHHEGLSKLKDLETSTEDVRSLEPIYLHHLASVWSVFPTTIVSQRPPIIFNPYFRKALVKKSEELLADDILLRKEGLEPLTFRELARACAERNLKVSFAEPENLKKELQEWLTYTKSMNKTCRRDRTWKVLHAPLALQKKA